MRIIFFMICMFTFMTANAEKVTIFAAASTTDAVKEIISGFESETGHIVSASFASSGTLAKQIANNAPADIFLSANTKWMKWLLESGKIEAGTQGPLLANRLVLVVPKTSSAPVSLAKSDMIKILSGEGRIAMGDPAHTPVGMYTQKTLEALGIWDKVQKKLVRMQTVRVALATVEKNAVPYGIVYASDAARSNFVTVAGVFDEDLHGPVRYPVAIVAGKRNDAVTRFYGYLKTEKSAKIFEKYGFTAVK